MFQDVDNGSIDKKTLNKKPVSLAVKILQRFSDN